MTGNQISRFDAALRAHHQASLRRLSPRILAQLAQRRHAMLRGNGDSRAPRLAWAAAGFAVLCALALGLQLRGPAAVPGAAGMHALATAGTPHSTILDEDPDFYAWLASDVGRQLAME